jgi:hypothetical protein
VGLDDLRFTEIEHKFIVSDGFDLARFRQTLDALGPTRTNSIRVRDRYYLTEGGAARGFVLRHRLDAELQQLTIKSLEPDTEVRSEVNLDLGRHAGDQTAQVESFVERLGLAWSGTIHKDVDVWYYPECEVVHYVATTDSLRIACVEFEATQKDSMQSALATLDRFERATGFFGQPRSHVSLPQLLFPDFARGAGHPPSDSGRLAHGSSPGG